MTVAAANPSISFTDAYQLFAVAFATVMFGHVYYPETGALPTSADTAIKIASSVGTVIGQIAFGLLSDLLGRKRVLCFSNKLTVDVWCRIEYHDSSNFQSFSIR